MILPLSHRCFGRKSGIKRVKQLIHALRNGLVLSTFTLGAQPSQQQEGCLRKLG